MAVHIQALARLVLFVATKLAALKFFYDLWRLRREAIRNLPWIEHSTPRGAGVDPVAVPTEPETVALPNGSWRLYPQPLRYGGEQFELRRTDDPRERMSGRVWASEEEASDATPGLPGTVTTRHWISIDGVEHVVVRKPRGLVLAGPIDDDANEPRTEVVIIPEPDGPGEGLPWSGLGTVSSDELDAWFRAARIEGAHVGV